MSVTGTPTTQADQERKELLDRIEETSIPEIEDFLGYPVTNEIIENLREHLEEAYDQMPEEEIESFEQKFGMNTTDKYFPEND